MIWHCEDEDGVGEQCRWSNGGWDGRLFCCSTCWCRCPYWWKEWGRWNSPSSYVGFELGGLWRREVLDLKKLMKLPYSVVWRWSIDGTKRKKLGDRMREDYSWVVGAWCCCEGVSKTGWMEVERVVGGDRAYEIASLVLSCNGYL